MILTPRSSAGRRILCPVLIGRETELGQLDALLRESLTGQGRTALISGEAGVGKTSVIRHFLQRARNQHARVLWGECTEIDARRPFGPFMDIARATNRVAALPIAARDARIGEPHRYQLHAAFTTLFADLAHERPTIVVIEDLHWADEASLELFPHLSRKLRDAPLLLIGTYRSDELHRRHPLRLVLAELNRMRVADDIALRRLSEDEVADFLREAMQLDRSPTPEFRRAIFETCDGNPLFMEEVLRALVERGDIDYRDGSWRRTKEVADIPIPDTLRDAILGRFRTLAEDAQSVLFHGAVIGQRFDFDLLLRVTGLDEAVMTGALRAGVEAQLVVERTEDGRLENYAFRHALTRKSILLELLRPERRRIHAVVGAAIESRAGVDAAAHAEELAYHFDEAQDRPRAFRYHSLASHEAYRAFAFARVARHLERAVELASGDEPTVGDLQLRLADAANLAATPRQALRAAQEARRWFAQAGDSRGAGLALTRIASYRWFLGETRGARMEAEEAARLLAPLGESQELAAAHARVARLAGLDLDFPTAAAWGRRALDMARDTGALGTQVDALTTLGSADRWLGRTDGVAMLREAIGLASGHDMVEAAMRGFHNLALALFATGSSAAESRRVHAEMFAYARRHGFQMDVTISDEASDMVADGDWEAALSRVQEARGESVWSSQLQLLEAFIRAGRDGPALSLPLLEEPRRRLAEASGSHRISGVSMLGRVSFLADDAKSTLEHLDGVASDIGRGFYTAPQVDEAVACALAAAVAQDNGAALARWIKVALSDDAGVRRLSARARRAFAQAAVAAQKGDVSASIPLLTESAELFKQSLMPFGETLARRRRVELLLRRNDVGDAEAAKAELAAILPYWRRANAVWYLGQLESWAADRGLTVPAEATAAAAPVREKRSQLTARELEVAALVAMGLSNKQIAEKLVISERTAEGHVERILGKLGFHSRSQIASWQAGGDPTHSAS